LVDVDTGKPFSRTSRRYSYAPTTLTTLAALVPQELHAQIEIYDQGVEALPNRIEADLVGISTITANAPCAYALADDLRAQGIKVVLGGYHPSACPEEALGHADAVVVGFAEESWPQLLRDFAAGQMQPLYRDMTQTVFQGSMPFPRRDLLRRGAYLLRGTIETTRGCLNRCEYCVIPNSTGGALFHRPIPEVIREIEQLQTRYLTFLDSSPTEDMEYAKELYRAMLPLKRTWFSAITVKAVYDDEWLDLAVRSGCRGVLVGLETLSQSTLNGCCKRFNKAGEYKQLIERLHERKITVLGCFVFGLDGDDRSIFARTVDFVNDAKVDICQYTISTPFPGSATYEKLKREGRITETDWRYYDGKHVVFAPSHMTEEDLENGIRWAWKRTYSFASIGKRMWGAKISTPTLIAGNLAFRKLARSFVPRAFDTASWDDRFRTAEAMP
ncbi:MAG: B12-binding domain-containing radical SAM protein, partial [Myxococcota bacterium]|nr:B12-binding domain-containing radical SAM protein [Myxococcota bacterium]